MKTQLSAVSPTPAKPETTIVETRTMSEIMMDLVVEKHPLMNRPAPITMRLEREGTDRWEVFAWRAFSSPERREGAEWSRDKSLVAMTGIVGSGVERSFSSDATGGIAGVGS
jgi:hypothetical protein